MKISHMALFTKNLECIRNFYVRYFQGTSNEMYHNQKKGFRSYFVSFDYGASIEIMSQDEGLVDNCNSQTSTGYAHIAFDVSNRETVDSLTNLLKEDNYKITSEPRVTGDGYYESCVLDPDGNKVEITCSLKAF